MSNQSPLTQAEQIARIKQDLQLWRERVDMCQGKMDAAAVGSADYRAAQDSRSYAQGQRDGMSFTLSMLTTGQPFQV